MDETPQLPTPGEAEGDRSTTDPPAQAGSADPAADSAADAPTLPNPSQAEGEAE